MLVTSYKFQYKIVILYCLIYMYISILIKLLNNMLLSCYQKSAFIKYVNHALIKEIWFCHCLKFYCFVTQLRNNYLTKVSYPNWEFHSVGKWWMLLKDYRHCKFNLDASYIMTIFARGNLCAICENGFKFSYKQ